MRKYIYCQELYGYQDNTELEMQQKKMVKNYILARG